MLTVRRSVPLARRLAVLVLMVAVLVAFVLVMFGAALGRFLLWLAPRLVPYIDRAAGYVVSLRHA
jgi:hypothetical protein